MKHKPSSGTGMLSAAGLSGSGTGKPKTLSLAPPPTGARKISSPLPPPPNDPAARKLSASTCRDVGHEGKKDSVTNASDPLSDLSQLEVQCPLLVVLFVNSFRYTHGTEKHI